MKDKRIRPDIDEDENVGLVCEPAVAEVTSSVRPSNGGTAVHDWIDDLDWDRFPSYGPSTIEEAFERIEKAENDLNDPSKWVSSEEMHKFLSEKFPCLR